MYWVERERSGVIILNKGEKKYTNVASSEKPNSCAIDTVIGSRVVAS